jgi:quercetin dioxygenase-like cupin family protein
MEKACAGFSDYSVRGIFAFDPGQVINGFCTGSSMALPHATSGDVIDVTPLRDRLVEALSTAIIRTPHLELIRSVLQHGRVVPEHKIDGELTILCIEGKLRVHAHDRDIPLAAGELLYLAGGVPHAVTAEEDSSALLTLLRRPAV